MKSCDHCELFVILGVTKKHKNRALKSAAQKTSTLTFVLQLLTSKWVKTWYLEIRE
jgi:hypothetical protein